MIHKIKIDLSDSQLEEFCRSHYYYDEDEDGRAKWQPFEDDTDETIEKHIDNDVWALKRFLGITDKGRWEE